MLTNPPTTSTSVSTLVEVDQGKPSEGEVTQKNPKPKKPPIKKSKKEAPINTPPQAGNAPKKNRRKQTIQERSEVAAAPSSLPPASKKPRKQTKPRTPRKSDTEKQIVTQQTPQESLPTGLRSQYLNFTVFRDLTRDIAAIGPKQLIIAVEGIREPGTWEELLKDQSFESPQQLKDFQCKLLSVYFSVPHFLPLTRVYNATEPFARILRFSQLEEFTSGVVGEYQLSSYRFYGPRYENQVPLVSAENEKKPAIKALRARLPNPNGYQENCLIIKHPILSFYSRKNISLQFVVLKKIRLNSGNTSKSPVVGHLKFKVVQLKRSEDLKNIEIYVDEQRLSEPASDVTEMNHQNIQPVINSSTSGLIPVLQRQHVYPSQEQQSHPVTYQIQQPAAHQLPEQFQYMHYQVPQTSLHQQNFLPHEQGSLLLQVEGQDVFRTSDGGESVFILSGNDIANQISFVQQPHHSVPQPLQQPQYFHRSEQVITQQPIHQQIVVQQPQVPQAQLPKKLGSRLIYLPGVGGGEQPIELEFLETDQHSATQVPQPHIQFRPGQQIIIQPGGQTNSYQIQQQSPQYQQYNTAQIGGNQSVIVQHQAPLHQQQTQFRVAQNSQSDQLVQSSSPAVQSPLQPIQNSYQQQPQNTVYQVQHPSAQHNQLQLSYGQQVTQVKEAPQQKQPVPFASPQQRPVVPSTPSQSGVLLSPPQHRLVGTSAPPPVSQSATPPKSKAKKPKKQPELNHAPVHVQHPPFIGNQQQSQPGQFPYPSQRAPTPGSGPPLSPFRGPVPPANLPPNAGSPLRQYSSPKSQGKRNTLGPNVSATTGQPQIKSVQSLASPQQQHFVSSSTNIPVQGAAKLTHSTTPASETVPVSSSASPIASHVPQRNLIIVPSTPQPQPPPPVKREYKAKPGQLAVCPHCGVCNKNIVYCERCKRDLPADVKFINDTWSVNSKGAAVAIQSSSSASVGPSKSTPLSKLVDKKVNVAVAKKPKTTKKIVIVNQPQAPTIVATTSGNKTVPPGSVLVQPQPDGACAVTINSGSAVSSTVVPQKGQQKVATPKRRAPARKRPAECITLSSDEEETEPTAPKQSKEEVKPPEPTASSLVASAKKEIAPAPAPAPEEKEIESQADTMGKKELKINLSEAPAPAKTENTNVDVEEVRAKIDLKMSEVGARFEYVTLACRSVRFGTYRVVPVDGTPLISVHLTELGIRVNLQSAQYRTKQVKVCIPMECILELRTHLSKRLSAIFVTTGPKYAVWARQELGLDGDPKMEGSNFFCPLEGNSCQKYIVLLANSHDEQDAGIIKKWYHNVIRDLDYGEANNLLMQINPQSFRSSIGMNCENSSTENSPAPNNAQVVSNGTPSSPSGSTVGMATTVAVATPGEVTSTTPRRELSEQDLAKVILSYDAVNKGRVDITPTDIKCLGCSQFLNDQIIELWLAVIQKERLSEEDRKRTFVYDSFFYSKLTEKPKRKTEEEMKLSPSERRHSRVKKRTKNVDIFSKDFLVIPINENYHWFIAIICFPWMEGYHDYKTLEPLPEYNTKKPKTVVDPAKPTNSSKKPIVYNQPQHGTTASYSNRDEAPEEDEQDQISSPDTPMPNAVTDGKSQSKTDNSEAQPSTAGVKKKTEERAVKRPCILVFDSLTGESRARIYSTLREYLKVEYKIKKNADRIFSKDTIPAWMPKVPQQPNFSDCGLFMLEYVEAFFRNPIPTFEAKNMNLKKWFDETTFGVTKRMEIFHYIRCKIQEKSPQHLEYIPEVSFDPDENDEENLYNMDLGHSDDMEDEDYEESDSSGDEEMFDRVKRKKSLPNPAIQKKPKLSASSDNEDHNYATATAAASSATKPTLSSTAAALAASPPSAKVTITAIRPSSDTTPKKDA